MCVCVAEFYLSVCVCVCVCVCSRVLFKCKRTKKPSDIDIRRGTENALYLFNNTNG